MAHGRHGDDALADGHAVAGAVAEVPAVPGDAYDEACGITARIR
jgi:hypothetical protein